MAISTEECFQENGGSDSDSNCTDGSPDYYQPISAVDDQDDVSDQNSAEDKGDHDPGTNHFDSFRPENPNFYQFSNGFVNVHRAENGIAALQLNGDIHGSDDDEEEEEQRMREASDSAIARAFREDESRRNAPVTPENAMRIMDAMRGVSFGGLTPDWAHHVPEDRWVDQLQSLRQPPSTTATTTATTQN